ADLYDLGETISTFRTKTTASGPRIDRATAEQRTAVADALGVRPERIGEIASDYRYRVRRAIKTSDAGSLIAPSLNEGKLEQWRRERVTAGERPNATKETPQATETGIVETAPVEFDGAANEAATSPLNDTPEPTEAQKQAGNYKLGHVR